MRNNNRLILRKCENALISIEKIKNLESFLTQFNFLILGRDNIVCNKYVFSLQTILNSAKATLGNIVDCCKCFCIADTYMLLRKYRDDLFFCLYLVIFDTSIKLGSTKNTDEIQKNIERWCENSLNNLNVSKVLSTIGRSDK